MAVGVALDVGAPVMVAALANGSDIVELIDGRPTIAYDRTLATSSF